MISDRVSIGEDAWRPPREAPTVTGKKIPSFLVKEEAIAVFNERKVDWYWVGKSALFPVMPMRE